MSSLKYRRTLSAFHFYVRFLSILFLFLCGFFTLKTESCFNNNAIILFSKDHHFLALCRLPNKENRNQHIAEADAYKQWMLFSVSSISLTNCIKRNCIRIEFIYFCHELFFFSFCHNLQFFIDFLFGACVRSFARSMERVV